MSNTSIKVAIELFMVLATPAASFARGGGGRGGGSATTGLSGGARPNAATGAQWHAGDVDRPERGRQRFQGSPDSAAAHNRPDVPPFK